MGDKWSQDPAWALSTWALPSSSLWGGVRSSCWFQQCWKITVLAVTPCAVLYLFPLPEVPKLLSVLNWRGSSVYGITLLIVQWYWLNFHYNELAFFFFLISQWNVSYRKTEASPKPDLPFGRCLAPCIQKYFLNKNFHIFFSFSFHQSVIQIFQNFSLPCFSSFSYASKCKTLCKYM